MKAVVFTLGCKVNSRESASLISGLNRMGYETSDKLEYADLYVINTCAVTAEAEKKSRQAIARVKKYNPGANIYVCGCASQKNAQAFIDKGALVVTGAKSKDKLLDLIGKRGVFIEQSDEYYEKYFPAKSSKTREYVKIQDGCDNFCAYCIIPYLRGRSRSRKVENVVEEVRLLGAQETVITGINVSAYQDGENGLSELIEALSVFDCRIRFGSLEVVSIDDKLLLATKKLKDFAPHFHLSLQSGSDEVLAAMNRRYTTEDYARRVELIRSYYPNAAITTDIIVGYSAESEQSFIQTLEFCDRIRFADIHCFPYSVREGTEGAKLKSLSEEVKRDRMARITHKKAELKRAYLESNYGKILSLIPEEQDGEYTVGYTQNYIRAYVKAKCLPAMCDVRIGPAYKDGVLAELCD